MYFKGGIALFEYVIFSYIPQQMKSHKVPYNSNLCNLLNLFKVFKVVHF